MTYSEFRKTYKWMLDHYTGTHQVYQNDFDHALIGKVKTHYSISFDFHDFVKIFTQAKEDPTRIHAFDDFNLDDTTMGNLRTCYKSLGKLSFFLSAEETKQQCENLKYIVRKLGFDEIDNYGGFYGRDKDEYHISVYNRGADI